MLWWLLVSVYKITVFFWEPKKKSEIPQETCLPCEIFRKDIKQIVNASLFRELNKTLKRRMLLTWHIIKITAYTLKKCLFYQNAKVHDEQHSAKFIVCMFFGKLWAREDSEMQSGKCCHGDHMARKRHARTCLRRRSSHRVQLKCRIHFSVSNDSRHARCPFLLQERNLTSPYKKSSPTVQAHRQASSLSL